MASQVRVIAGELKGFTERKVRELTLAVTANLTERTPIDTGWARANWVPRIGQPFEGVAGSRDSVSSAEQAAGQASVLGYKLEQGAVFVSNGVPYIKMLAFGGYGGVSSPFGEISSQRSGSRRPKKTTPSGFSTQAPNGFVEQSIDAAIREVSE